MFKVWRQAGWRQDLWHQASPPCQYLGHHLRKNLGASSSRAEACMLGATNAGAKLKFYFSKCFLQGSIRMNLSKKELKKQKRRPVRTRGARQKQQRIGSAAGRRA